MTLEELETHPAAVPKAHDDLDAAKAKLAAANSAITETSARLIRAKEALIALDNEGFIGRGGEGFYAFQDRRQVLMTEVSHAQSARETAERAFERAKEAMLAK